MTHTLRTLAPADEAAVHALWAICFDAPYLPALHALDPDRHRRTFVAARGDTVDAVVCYVPRQFRDTDGRVERVGGIGNVAARPEARGQGLVRRLLTLAAEAVIAESSAWSLLFTATPGVYERRVFLPGPQARVAPRTPLDLEDTDPARAVPLASVLQPAPPPLRARLPHTIRIRTTTDHQHVRCHSSHETRRPGPSRAHTCRRWGRSPYPSGDSRRGRADIRCPEQHQSA